MRLLRLFRGRTRAALSSAGILLLSVALTVAAVISQGYTTTELSLNDGGVWVTKPSGLLVGHLNSAARVLDSGLTTTSNEFDIVQAGNTILVHDTSKNTVTPINPASVTLGQAANIPARADVSLGSSTVAIADASSGKLWVLPASALGGFNASAPATYRLGAHGVATVGPDGTVYAASASKHALVTIATDDSGNPTAPQVTDLTGLSPTATLSIAAIGNGAAVFDASHSSIFLPGTSTSTHIAGAANAVLQQSGPAGSTVLLESKTALISQPLDGSTAHATSAHATGSPAAPVYLNGCGYAAWSGSNRYLRSCAGGTGDTSAAIAGAIDSAQLVFRVNRDVVVLNDLTSGSVWLPNQNMVLVNNWDDVKPPPDTKQQDNQDNSTQDVLSQVDPTHSSVNHPPVAVDDTFGVRAGRSTILHVLDNDSDPDGDLLTASVADPKTSLGMVEAIAGGQLLQIDVPASATGATTFEYQVSDGRGGTAHATVHLSVHPPSQNSAPVQNRVSQVLVEQGASVSFNMLGDWSDPDGDDMYLASATSTTDDGVHFAPDGTVTFDAVGRALGTKIVDVVVTDGQKSAQGTLLFDVRAAGTTKPIANADLVTAHTGQTVTVSPLLNDQSPSGKPLTLAKVDDVQGATIAPDLGTATFTFVAATAGTYLVHYVVSDGPNTADGFVRVDVIPAMTAELPPIAVRDTALLPKGKSVLVDVLANDTDPDGGILVVQSVTVPQNSGLAVAVINHQIVRITDQPGISAPVTFDYTVSNGHASAQSQVTVLPVPAPAKLEPPVAVADHAVVRVGDIVTIPVLANDYSPSGDTLTLDPTLVTMPDAKAGLMFTAQNTLRFQAGNTPQTVNATYNVVDSQGQKAAGYVTIQIMPAANANNAAPVPQSIVARTIAGTTQRIPIPLDGIDPDGDSVELVGQGTAPKLGRISEVGATWLTYQAYPTSAGTDAFTYVVRDRLGAEATGSIEVGVVPPSTTSQRPYAVGDHVTVRPSRTVSVDVLANDSDPNGSALSLTSKLVVPKGLSARVSAGQVVVDTPASDGNYTVQYTIANSLGATATGALQVTVDKNAPLLQPIARDDVVPVADTVGKKSVDVRVLDNDQDPDGIASDLIVHLVAGGGTVSSRGVVTVPVLQKSQTLAYTVTDPDKLTGTAFIIVPGTDDQRPTLKAFNPVVVKSGQSVTLKLADYVAVVPGRTPTLVSASSVSAAHANGSSLVKDNSTLVYTSAKDYFGPDAVTFQVTDGATGGDKNAHTAILSIPITVSPPDNQPPTFSGASIQVAPGEAPSTIDLRSASADPDPGDLAKLRYALADPRPSGLTVSINGSTLSVAAPSNAKKGTHATVNITVTDGKSPAVSGSVAVALIGSTRPLPVATDDVVSQAAQGQTITVNPLTNDFNPFPATPLTIISATVETGVGSVSVNGSSVSITPGSSFVGTMVVRYRIGDATDDPDRQADGRIRVTVQGKPDAPGTPTTADVGDGSLTLSWAAGSDNGAAITGYTVTGGGYSKDCPATTCQLTGLTNNVQYSFTVVAHNSVGTSPASAQSASARPDVKPDTMAAPTLTVGDGMLTAAWAAATTHGSPVTSYDLQLTPGGTILTGLSGTSKQLTGLQNGTAYQVQVRAHNSAPTPSDWSATSAATTPAGNPAAPGVTASGGATTVSFAWTLPATNGRPIASVHYIIDGGGEQTAGPTNGGTTVGNGYNQTHSIQVWVVDSDGRVGGRATASGATSNPIPNASISAGGAQNTTSCTSTACKWLVLSLSGGRANTTYTVQIETNCAAPGRTGTYACSGENIISGYLYTMTTDGAGNVTDSSSHVYGFPQDTLNALVYLNGTLVSTSPGYTWW